MYDIHCLRDIVVKDRILKIVVKNIPGVSLLATCSDVRGMGKFQSKDAIGPTARKCIPELRFT